MITKKYYKLVKVSYEDSGYFYIKNTSNQTGTLTIRSQQYNGKPANGNLEYSTDGVNWNQVADTSVDDYTFTLQPNTNIYFRGNYDTNVSELYRPNFKMDVSHIIGGNILSLADKSNFETKTSLSYIAFSYMFRDDVNLVSAKDINFGNLNTITNNCCKYMFKGCTGLTDAPAILSATTLANSCYTNMFENCTSLTSAPELPATALAANCYYSMFNGCTSLTVAPELPASTLASGCYYTMFNGCTSLNTVTCLATDISAGGTTNWLQNVAANGTFTKSAFMSGWTTGNSGIPSGWTVVDA